MKRLLFILALLCVPAWATFTYVQNPVNDSCCNNTTCTLTVTSTVAGHVAVIMGFSSISSTIASVAGASGTWVVPAGCQSVHGGIETSCAYNLNLTGSVTSIVVTWSVTPGASAKLHYYEYSYTGASVVLDTGASGGLGVSFNTSNNPQPGVALTLGCTNCVIVQEINLNGAAASSVSTYTHFAGAAFFGTADLINTSSGSAPSWTLSGSAAASGAAVALTENAASGNCAACNISELSWPQ